jgi:hypothetical protein
MLLLLLMMSHVLIMVGIDLYCCHLKMAKIFGIRMRGVTRQFSLLQNVQNGRESLSFIFNGYQNSFPGVKWPGRKLVHCQRLRMSGALPLLPQYAFLAWISTVLPSFIFSMSEIKLGTNRSVAVDGATPLASYHGLLIKPRENPLLLTEQQSGKNTFGFVLKEKTITLSIIAFLPSSDFICRACEKKKEY